MAVLTKQEKAQKILEAKYSWAQKFLDAYFTVIPLIGKEPAIKAWQVSKGIDCPETLGKTQNYGVVIPSDVLVIDVDFRNFPKDESDKVIKPDPLERLTEKLGYDITQLDTLRVRTGSGGYHIYLNKKPLQCIKENIPNFKGLEFKHKGRQVVGPYSRHPESQKLYRVENGSPDDLLVCPDNLIRFLHRQNYDMNGDNAFKGEATENDIMRYVHYLRCAEPAVEGAEGDNQTYHVACRGAELGLNVDQTHSCMLMHWNGRCNPPWDAQDLLKKVRNAYSYNKDKFGKRSHVELVKEFSDLVGTDTIIDASSRVTKDHQDRGLPTIMWEHDVKNGGFKKSFNNTVNLVLAAAFRPEEDEDSVKKLDKRESIDDTFKYNLFTDCIEVYRSLPWDKSRYFRPRVFNDSDATEIRFALSRRYHYNTTDMDVFAAVLVAAKHRCYHPVCNYLRGLVWDGVPRVNTWLKDYAGVNDSANSLYVRAVSRKVLAAAVRRVMQPGCKFDYVMVLEGVQGIGKSMLVQALGGEWAGNITIDPSNKDSIMYMEGQWVVEMSEMVAQRRTAADALKDFITRGTDKIRKPYARTPVSLPRQSIFIGTINPQHGVGYLKDPTGNRRFWPIEVEHVRIDALKEDVDQLWAEAVVIEGQGEQLFLTPEEERYAVKEQFKRVTKDPFEIPVLEFINNTVLAGQVVTPEIIMKQALLIPYSNMRDHDRGRVVSILNKHFVAGNHYDMVDKKTRYGYIKDKRKKD
jgi:predicted P-loop ATPase